MTSLAARFREVELTLEKELALPPPWPENWLQAKSAGSVVRFVESRFEDERTTAEIRRVFGEVNGVEFRAMSLRAIFLAMARRGTQGQEAL